MKDHAHRSDSRMTPARKKSDVLATGISPWKLDMKIVREACNQFKEYMMVLWCTDITYKILDDSGIGKTLKYFQDFCKAYEEDLTDLGFLINMSEKILFKWKNYVMNYVFDYKLPTSVSLPHQRLEELDRDNLHEFIKYESTHGGGATINASALPNPLPMIQ